jgi:hypothetical protein
MTTPHSEGWYHDPDGSDAERYFDGLEWTPRRRRKPPTPKRPPQVSDPYGSGPAYPAPAPGPYVPPAPTGPAIPYDAYPPAPIPAGYGPPPHGPVDPYGQVQPFGYPQQPALSRLQSTMATGVHRTVGVMLAATGLALIIVAFVPWGRARKAATDEGAVISATVSFPGLGRPTTSGTYSHDDFSLGGNMNIPLPFQNTNPGWISLTLGIVALIASAAYLWLPQRKTVGIAIGVLGGIVGAICVSHFFDVRAAFGSPPDLANFDFSVDIGLIAACVLSFAVTGLGVWAYMLEQKSNHWH